MNQTTENTDVAAARADASDRPPIGRFLLLFAGLVAFALGLSMLPT